MIVNFQCTKSDLIQYLKWKFIREYDQTEVQWKPEHEESTLENLEWLVNHYFNLEIDGFFFDGAVFLVSESMTIVKFVKSVPITYDSNETHVPQKEMTKNF